jgi:peptidoglycan/xylan/chitin deacetylase (PgdA/CDA1 family)
MDQLRILKRVAEVIDLNTYLKSACLTPSNKPYIILTFDDAYKDNYEIVAPALEKFGFHATFFVSSGYIENEKTLPFDARTIGRRIDLMSWNEISDLKNRGFGIGAHTVNHINCAMATTQELEEELKDCAFVLKSKLGIENLAFAYPFGGRRHINPAIYNLLVKYNYCAALSNFGGANSLIPDKYEIKRYGVDYRFSEKAFLARVEGLPFSGR